VKISIVIPVHNEAGNIASLIEETGQALCNAEAYEIIVVDDGSQDCTANVLKNLLDNNTQGLRVIRHQQRYGQSTALHTGIKMARFDHIATLDGDGQNDPADIARLYQLLIQQHSTNAALWMVAGWRKSRHDSQWRLFSSQFANTIRAKLLHDHTPDTGCGTKVFFKDKFLQLPYFDHMHRFLPALMIRAGGKVISEPVNHRPRLTGQSNYRTLDRLAAGIIDLLGVIWLQRRAKVAVAEEVGCDQ